MEPCFKYIEKVEPATDDVTVIRGCDISRGKFSKRQRGQLAIEVIEGRAIITGLSKRQLAQLSGCRPATSVRFWMVRATVVTCSTLSSSLTAPERLEAGPGAHPSRCTGCAPRHRKALN